MHTHTRSARTHSRMNTNTNSKLQLANAKVMQLRSCKFVYTSFHVASESERGGQ